jgi:predicted RNA-binding protein
MAKFRGKVTRSDLEGGHWQLVADDGTTYVLEGAPKSIEVDGAKVEIEGAVDKNVMSFAMTGPTLKVKSGKTLG